MKALNFDVTGRTFNFDEVNGEYVIRSLTYSAIIAVQEITSKFIVNTVNVLNFVNRVFKAVYKFVTIFVQQAALCKTVKTPVTLTCNWALNMSCYALALAFIPGLLGTLIALFFSVNSLVTAIDMLKLLKA